MFKNYSPPPPPPAAGGSVVGLLVVVNLCSLLFLSSSCSLVGGVGGTTEDASVAGLDAPATPTPLFTDIDGISLTNGTEACCAVEVEGVALLAVAPVFPEEDEVEACVGPVVVVGVGVGAAVL